MVASYPGANPTLPLNQVNGVDIVDADDVNLIYDELKAVASTLGLNPQNRSAAWSSNSYSTASTNFSTVGARIKNVEDGVQVITGKAVTTDGGRTILPAGTSTVNLGLKAQTSQTANLLEVRNSADTLVTAINAAGNIVTIDGGSA